ncbi:cupredoxin domain-containing protein [Arthrobacter sp. H14]|uniref:cupredoxin domain-containing protein n=1 Tax=Arthrobacter sp. H14 TaxID=1312959 RepID=UPI00047A6FE5|nr:cupredoxin domain-containing protein [Arthrobacter sp. H14]
MNIRKSASAIVLTAALTGLSGCGSSGQDTAGESQSPADESMAVESPSASGTPTGGTMATSGKEEVVITVEGFKFNGPESVSPGATVTVVNKDSAPHTVTSEEEGLFDVQFEGGETVTFTAPEEPGEYPYICTIHPAMMATLMVE